jgi:hypothetical protein
MNASYDYKDINKTMTTQMKKINLPNLIIILAIIYCANSIANHFIAKWDGHFHDTKGCTTIQSKDGKLFQVNSCENSIVPIVVQPEAPLKAFNNFNPDDMEPPPTAKPQAPLKKSPHPKEPADPKPPAPLMT